MAMTKFWAPSFIVTATLLSVACGGGTSRQLQSISIKSTANGQQIQLVATGTFSASPLTVSPLPVDWSMGLLAPPPLRFTYALTTQPFVLDCTVSGVHPVPITAVATSDPKAPSSGALPMSKMVTASLGITCP